MFPDELEPSFGILASPPSLHSITVDKETNTRLRIRRHALVDFGQFVFERSDLVMDVFQNRLDTRITAGQQQSIIDHSAHAFPLPLSRSLSDSLPSELLLPLLFVSPSFFLLTAALPLSLPSLLFLRSRSRSASSSGVRSTRLVAACVGRRDIFDWLEDASEGAC